MSKGLKLSIGLVVTLLIITALYIFYILDPEAHPLFPKCLFLLATGFECPGCGSQRAVHQLLHLNFGAALKYNSFMVLSIPYIFLGVYLQFFGGSVRNPQLEKIFFGRWSALVVLVFVLSFWILRNIF